MRQLQNKRKYDDDMMWNVNFKQIQSSILSHIIERFAGFSEISFPIKQNTLHYVRVIQSGFKYKTAKSLSLYTMYCTELKTEYSCEENNREKR